jgi:hypothetical protein
MVDFTEEKELFKSCTLDGIEGYAFGIVLVEPGTATTLKERIVPMFIADEDVPTKEDFDKVVSLHVTRALKLLAEDLSTKPKL